MRTNSMAKCAVGAMLIGGTLGLAQTASAVVVNAGGTVTFLNTAPGTGPSQATSNSTLYNNAPAFSGAEIGFNSGSLSYSLAISGGTTSATSNWTAPVAAGVWTQSISASASRTTTIGSSGGFTLVSLARVFTVASGFAAFAASLTNINSVASSSISNFYIYNVDPVTGATIFANPVILFNQNMAAGEVQNFSGTLVEGTYQFSALLVLDANTAPGQWLTFNIPAPGAIALLGAAGLVGSRRRPN